MLNRICPDIETLFTKSVQQLALWRDNGGQVFLGEEELNKTAKNYEFELTPRIATISALPVSTQETHEFLKTTISKTSVALDEGAGGQAEGIVARTVSRSAIAKLRFEDYERHAKRRSK